MTKSSPEDALLSAHQSYIEDVLQNARDLKKPLLKELPCRHGPPPKNRPLGLQPVLG